MTKFLTQAEIKIPNNNVKAQNAFALLLSKINKYQYIFIQSENVII